MWKLSHSKSQKLFDCVKASANDSRLISCQWGKLASSILSQEWATAHADMQVLKKMIESGRNRQPQTLLKDRTCFIHWSLFVFFNHPDSISDMIDLFFGQQYSNWNSVNVYMNALQMGSPHLLRYLSVALIISPKKIRDQYLKDLIRVIEQVLAFPKNRHIY